MLCGVVRCGKMTDRVTLGEVLGIYAWTMTAVLHQVSSGLSHIRHRVDMIDAYNHTYIRSTYSVVFFCMLFKAVGAIGLLHQSSQFSTL